MTSNSDRQQAKEFTWQDSQGNMRSFPYWIYFPADLGDQANAPLLLFLHGAGERGTDLQLVNKHGPPKLISNGQEFPFVVASPQCPLDHWRAMREMVDGVASFTKALQAEHSLDKSRTYATGMSMGGYGTWALAAAYPELFAAIVPVCGGADRAWAPKLKQTPAWAFHGDQDEIVPPIRSQEIVDAISEIGGDARLTMYENVQHDSWSATYDNPAVYTWLLTHLANQPE